MSTCHTASGAAPGQAVADESAPGPGAAAKRRTAPLQVLLVGNPNVGKTTLFNRLTGARARASNYPGTSVDCRRGRLEPHLASHDANHNAVLAGVELIDLPGTNSLTARAPDEQLAIDLILPWDHRRTANAAIVVVSATSLHRGLYVALQVIETGIPTLIAVNMIDELEATGGALDSAELARDLGVPVVTLSAAKDRGLDGLCGALARLVVSDEMPASATAPQSDAAPATTLPAWLTPLSPNLQGALSELERVVAAHLPGADSRSVRARTVWSLLSHDADVPLPGLPPEVAAEIEQMRGTLAAHETTPEAEVIRARYAWIERSLARSVHSGARDRRLFSERLDALLTRPLPGLFTFALVMAALFEALFAWSEPATAAIEQLVAVTQSALVRVMPAGALRDLTTDGIVAGVGNVLAFVPQLVLLFTLMVVLEDSGYLARASFAIDRVMSGVGLSGKAFIPMLSGYACAIPAVLATRSIEERRDRLAVMLAIPLASCSARLPVYTLLVALFVPHQRTLGGALSLGTALLFTMYVLSALSMFGAAFVFRRIVLRGAPTPLLAELPPYRMPQLRNIAVEVWQRLRSFLTGAGTVILAMSVILWALLTYPKSADVAASQRIDGASVHSVAAPTARSERASDTHELSHTFAGRIGHALEPVLSPLGFDWSISVGLIGAFAAREVFISTLGVVYSTAERAEGGTKGLREVLRTARDKGGRPIFSAATCLSLMVFFLFACQCMSTLAVIRKESGSWVWPAVLFGYTAVLAYSASWLTYAIAARILG